jgi:uncharacterized protein YukE
MAFNTVDTSGFNEAIAGFERAIAAYKAAREAITHRARDLGNNWVGEGGESFRRANTRITQLLDDDEESLKAIIENLKDIRKAYTDWDAEAAKSIEGSGSS